MTTVVTDLQAKANVAANVQRLLKRKGWKQADLARATGESEMRISSLIRATAEPKIGVVARIADALGTTVDELLTLEIHGETQSNRMVAVG